MKKAEYLIIGNGIAGLSAAKEIRKKDKDGSIIMVGNEPYKTYYRIKLTELLAKDYDKEKILVNQDSWYEDNNIEVISSKIVEKLDLSSKKARLDDSQEIEFEKLLISTGSRPFIPPIEGNYKKGLFALRNLKDLDYIKNYLEDKEEVAVIGGGLLGLEAAWSLKQLGKTVHIIENSKGLLMRQLDEELSQRLTKELEEEGFIIHLDSVSDEILGDNDIVDGIRFKDDREIKVDAILMSTGVRPDLDLVRETELEIDRGLKVDKELKTNIPDVYGAGDVIEIDGMVLGLWTAAMEQGRIAGANMSGGEEKYDLPKLFASLNIGDIKLFSAGKTEDVDEIYEYECDGNKNKIFVENARIVGSILYGNTKDMMKFRKAVFSKMDVKEFLEENEVEDKYTC